VVPDGPAPTGISPNGISPNGISPNGILVHEWLAEVGGSEHVFDTLAGMFPEADLLCLWSDVKDRYPGRELRETALARSRVRRSKPAAVPASLLTWRRREGRHDWALISTHLFAHHYSERATRHLRKYLYVHSPARYLWEPGLDSRGAGVVRLASPPLRLIDRRRAREAHALAANSGFVAERVARVWHRHATVIHPPVDVDRVERSLAHPALTGEEQRILDALPPQFVLGASRMVPYKALDRVIRAAGRLGLPAVIAGSGPDEARLRALAAGSRVPVTFARRPSDGLLHHLYARSSVFVFPPVEDFGIMPVEALAAGTPVVVGPVGGAREIVGDTAAGVVADSASPEDLAAAAGRAMRLDRSACRPRARRFAHPVFRQRVHAWLGEHR
jgi:glycosyltransferase involved in cell wall biosynthesis